MQHERTIGSKGNGLWGMKGEQLPAYIQHVYNDMVEGGAPTGSATYRRAVGIVENWAAGHDGKGHKVGSDTQAKAAAAITEWNALRAKRHAQTAAGKVKEAILEAKSDGDAEDKKDGGADESSEMPSVYCVRDRKKVTPTKAKKCPSCGADLSNAVAQAKSVNEAVLDAVGTRAPVAGPFDTAQQRAIRETVLEATSAVPLSNLKQRPGESLASWGKRLQTADAQLAKKQQPKTRSGKSAGQSFNQLHPRGRGGQWTYKSGSSGQEVTAIQAHVGAKQDGQFGAGTRQAVIAFQRKHGIKVDGVVGKQTVAAMRGHRNAASVKPGAMSGADRAWLLRQLVKGGTRRRRHH